MSEPASISQGIAARYATAVFDIAKDEGALPALETDLDQLSAVLADSADFNDLINSPVYGRAVQATAVATIGDKMGLGDLVKKTLGLLADKRRLFVLPQLISALRARIAEHKGEVTAEVISAKALTKAQSEKLAKTLKDKVGQDVIINATVDESIIGGLVVKVGSTMIDTSIASKLAALQNTMKEVG